MIILGIETSCDETGVALVENGKKVLANVVASSIKLHIKTGGIIPENAARQQIKSIIPVLNQALTTAFPKKGKGIKSLFQNIDAIAVTVGPGLIGSLLVGVETARTLSYVFQKPIIPINHLLAHIYADFVETTEVPQFPIVALVVSGGHTDLVVLKKHGDIFHIGSTRDDAAGEAFDKTARLLGLAYPGGPSLSRLAQTYLDKKPQKLNLFPRPMINEDSFDFSFSGLKTAVLREVNKKSNTPKEILAAEIQEAVVDVLVHKSLNAVKKFNPKSLLLGGGVSANLRLREKIKEEMEKKGIKTKFFIPQPLLCTDNAVSVASCSFFNYNPFPWQKISVNPELTIKDKV